MLGADHLDLGVLKPVSNGRHGRVRPQQPSPVRIGVGGSQARGEYRAPLAYEHGGWRPASTTCRT